MEPEIEKNSIKIYVKLHLGEGFCKLCQPQIHWYDIHKINVGEMCVIPMNVHHELFSGVRQLRWQHLSPVVSTFSTSIRPLCLFLSPLSVIPRPVCAITFTRQNATYDRLELYCLVG